MRIKISGAGLIKQLVAPFFDVEAGGVMGRVVPLNAGTNLLTRLLDLERSGGYQVDQQARMNLRLVPQHGGTVAGVRLSALREIGGWNENSLTEDTDLTYRLLLNGWKTVYQNRSERYEEVPEVWPVRIKQIMRWAKGRNQAMRVDQQARLGVADIGNILLSPDEGLLYLTDFSVGRVSAARFDKTTGLLSPACKSAVLKGYNHKWAFAAAITLENTTLFVGHFVGSGNEHVGTNGLGLAGTESYVYADFSLSQTIGTYRKLSGAS